MKISVSFLKSNDDKKTTINKIEQTDCDFIHVDVMDGKFVSNTTEDSRVYLENHQKNLDVHLMVQDPQEYIDLYAKLNPEFITIHIELPNVKDYIGQIKKANIKAGLAINPQTDINLLLPYLKEIDQILVMGVQPGAGGQMFIDSCLKTVRKLSELKRTNQYQYLISVDGGINEDTAIKVKEAGVDMLVSGFFVCSNQNYQEQIDKLR